MSSSLIDVTPIAPQTPRRISERSLPETKGGEEHPLQPLVS